MFSETKSIKKTNAIIVHKNNTSLVRHEHMNKTQTLTSIVEHTDNTVWKQYN